MKTIGEELDVLLTAAVVEKVLRECMARQVQQDESITAVRWNSTAKVCSPAQDFYSVAVSNIVLGTYFSIVTALNSFEIKMLTSLRAEIAAKGLKVPGGEETK